MSRPASMSQAWKTSRSLKSRASSASSGRPSGQATRQSGSTLTIRASGQTERMASMPAMAARTSAILSSQPRSSPCGANSPFSPPA